MFAISGITLKLFIEIIHITGAIFQQYWFDTRDNNILKVCLRLKMNLQNV